MGVKERREREKADTRQTIIDAARMLFSSKGFEAVSMRQIAEAAEYSPTAIYVHFQDKEALFHELCIQDFSRLADLFRELSSIFDPVQRLLQLGHAYVKFASEFPHHYRLMFMTPQIPKPPAEDMRTRRGNPDQDGYAFLKWCVSQVIEAGLLRPEINDIEQAAQAFWSVAHGVSALEITKATDPWIEWRGRQSVSSLALTGLLRGMLRNPSTLDTASPKEGTP